MISPGSQIYTGSETKRVDEITNQRPEAPKKATAHYSNGCLLLHEFVNPNCRSLQPQRPTAGSPIRHHSIISVKPAKPKLFSEETRSSPYPAGIW
jgi:hypothetical protein